MRVTRSSEGLRMGKRPHLWVVIVEKLTPRKIHATLNQD
jgi:hypothetical protein